MMDMNQPIGPNECPKCPGMRHWPHNCPKRRMQNLSKEFLAQIKNDPDVECEASPATLSQSDVKVRELLREAISYHCANPSHLKSRKLVEDALAILDAQEAAQGVGVTTADAERAFRHCLQVGYNWGRTKERDKEPYDNYFGESMNLPTLREPECKIILALITPAAAPPPESGDAREFCAKLLPHTTSVENVRLVTERDARVRADVLEEINITSDQWALVCKDVGVFPEPRDMVVIGTLYRMLAKRGTP